MRKKEAFCFVPRRVKTFFCERDEIFQDLHEKMEREYLEIGKSFKKSHEGK
jgi:hypothetical protein